MAPSGRPSGPISLDVHPLAAPRQDTEILDPVGSPVRTGAALPDWPDLAHQAHLGCPRHWEEARSGRSTPSSETKSVDLCVPSKTELNEHDS